MLFTAVKKLIKVVRYNLWRILVNSFQLLNMEGIEKPQIITHIEKNLNYSLFDCKWIPCSAKFLVIGSQPKGTGTMEIYEIESGVAKQINVISNPNAFKCCTFGASNLKDRHLATGDFLGNLELWNLDNSVSIYAAKQHTDIINAIDALGGTSNNCGAPEIVTGSRDGTVKVWDPRQKDKAVASMEPNPGEARRDCWTVGFGNSFNNTERIVCAGYDNGDIKMFDLRMMAVRWECNLKNGICSLEFDRKDIPMNKLVAATLEGKFHVFDTRTQHPKKGFAQVVENDQKNGTVWLCRHLPQNRDLFITCAGTGHIMLWKYSYPDQRSKSDATGETCGVAGTLSRLQKMSLSSQPINSLDWSPDKQGLAVCTSFDQTLRVIITTKLNLY